MKLWLSVGIIVICTISSIPGLVHRMRLTAKDGGCEYEGNVIKVGEFVQDKYVCGIVFCQNEEGDALVHYCQIPAAFERCDNYGVSTDIDFPECCWKCVQEPEDCGRNEEEEEGEGKGEKGEGETGEGGEGETPEGEAPEEPAPEGEAPEEAAPEGRKLRMSAVEP